MTRRLFVCHANADTEATSEVIDALENALSFRAGSLWTSSLPGYSTEADDIAALRGALAGSDMVLAVVTDASVHDPHFLFQLGAAWALGAHTVLYLLDPAAQVLLPMQLSHAPVVYSQQPEQWSGLIGDLSLRLGLVPRPASSTTPSIAPLAPSAGEAPSVVAKPPEQPSFSAEPSQPTAADELAPPLEPQTQTAAPMPHSYLDELRAIGGVPHTPPPTDSATPFEERTPPRHSYIEDLRESDELAAEVDPASADVEIEEEPPTGEQPRVASPHASDAIMSDEDDDDADVQTVDSDVFARLPTCEMALEAGRAVSDCVFNRAEIDDFAPELDEPLGRLVESLGASWSELRNEQDLDTWVAVTDQLLQTLPDEVRKVEEWYKVGFELATLHNLAGQLVLDGSDAAAEQHWRGALERFLMRAEKAEIGYENLGRVLGLLENLAGPSHERDLANIPRSLEELRRYAAGADIHSAA